MKRIDKLDLFIGVVLIAVGVALEPNWIAAGIAGFCAGGGVCIGFALGSAGRRRR